MTKPERSYTFDLTLTETQVQWLSMALYHAEGARFPASMKEFCEALRLGLRRGVGLTPATP